MTRPAEAPAPAPLRWIPPWLAALPALYVISPLALLALPQLRRLPHAAWWVLGFYAFSQQLPALFSPEPLLASLLALVRTLLMLGLIGVGVSLRQSERLRWLGIGLMVVYVTALVFSGLSGADPFSSRLSHPYMTPITLGLAGAVGIWLALFAGGKLLWRVPLGLLGLGVLLLSGSRGPLAAALVGCVAGFIIRRGWRLALGVLVGAVLLAGGFYLGKKLEVAAITRLGNADTTGRDIVWYNTLSVIRSEPLSGVGSYLLGQRLAPPGDNCELWMAANGTAPSCPPWVKKLGSPWLIAHNIALQQLAETGPLGLLGLFVLLGAVVTAVFQNRNPLGLAVISGLLVATANDNTLLVPSPFFAEVFWVAAGAQLLRLAPTSLGAVGGWAAGLMLALSFPLLASRLPAPQVRPPPSLRFLNAPTQVRSPRAYTAFAQFDLPPGKYRANLRSCTDSCMPIVTIDFTAPASRQAPLLTLSGDLQPVPRQRLELLLYVGEGSTRPTPAGRRAWNVEIKP
ncbi:O-antigen ligase domain-containing protein [Deinococcus metallilatus]|uniref:O-antigen ligase n=1 Tax=Deinococcus metallilatus TaxID=1211322 RepID=A0AAJ5F4K9_9DEIO|nr:O-antigen ligase family protein [Deinococcus metallilatus]MBB5297031.1 O-antigen ligase [Deinococcus metallilatus]QBY07840.1 O-antigen ligase domain-containing protein [Deinococcus metallilatus]RXJ13189.1 O-antigen ligase domain-containing protein [Deinococcus metallilatus]TLK23038.1 O-antigen ligase family protein [Deinococcus metallilatus]